MAKKKSTAGPKYPRIRVHLGNLLGPEGNAFVILGRCQTAMRDAKLSEDEHKAFFTEAESGDCENLLRTVRKWFRVSGGR